MNYAALCVISVTLPDINSPHFLCMLYRAPCMPSASAAIFTTRSLSSVCVYSGTLYCTYHFLQNWNRDPAISFVHSKLGNSANSRETCTKPVHEKIPQAKETEMSRRKKYSSICNVINFKVKIC